MKKVNKKNKITEKNNYEKKISEVSTKIDTDQESSTKRMTQK